MAIATPPIGHVTNLYGFIFTSARLITTKPGIMKDEQAPTVIYT